MRSFIAGVLSIVLLLLLLAGAAVVWLRTATRGFSAHAQPTALETRLATFARDQATPTAVRTLHNPVTPSPAVLQAAMAHYADHCAVCHGNNGSGDTMFGRGMYPKPPDLRQSATQSRTDGELFSIIEDGIRMSGMPAFGAPDGSTAEESWKLVVFLRHLPSLTPAEEQAMNGMNPKTPDELEEEQQEQQFLNGNDTPAHARRRAR